MAPLEVDVVELCRVCGSDNTCYRLSPSSPHLLSRVYGALVCPSCRVFFRRCVKSPALPTCRHGSCCLQGSARSGCRACRYAACLTAGMQPRLVGAGGNGRKLMVAQHQEVANIASQVYPTLAKELRTTAFGVQDFNFYFQKASQTVLEDREIFACKTYYSHISVVIDNLIHRRETAYYACHHTKANLKLEWCELGGQCIIHVHMFVIFHVMTEFFRIFMPTVSEATFAKLARSLRASFSGLLLCLGYCFFHLPSLVQIKQILLCPSSLSRSIPDEGYAEEAKLEWCMRSPWAENIEEEMEAEALMTKMAEVVQGDQAMAKLITFLVLFSPAETELDKEELDIMKLYQGQISMLIHHYLLNTREYNNMRATEELSMIVRIVNNLDKVGSNNIYAYDDLTPKSVDINSIEIDPLD